MEQFDLDLDVLQPKSKLVKLGGQIYKVEPPKFKTTLKLTQLAREFSKVENEDDGIKLVEDLKEVLEQVMPDLKKDDIDLSFDQMLQLMNFVVAMASNDAKRLEEAAPKKVVKKK